jgi:hypothetical protein
MTKSKSWIYAMLITMLLVGYYEPDGAQTGWRAVMYGVVEGLPSFVLTSLARIFGYSIPIGTVLVWPILHYLRLLNFNRTRSR